MDDENGNRCAENINSIASTNVSRRDLVRMRDLISFLDSNLRDLAESQPSLHDETSGMIRDTERLNSLFKALFGEQIENLSILGRMDVSDEETLVEGATPDQITLALSEPVQEQVRSIMDIIRHLSEKGPATRETVTIRAREIGIDDERLEDILRWLERSGAISGSGGTIRLM